MITNLSIKNLAISICAVAFAVLAIVTTPANAAEPWSATGEYDITFMLDGDPTPYVHDASLVQTGTSIDGVGGYPSGGSHTYDWDVTSGLLSGSTLTLDIDYTFGAVGTNMDMTGNIASDGTVLGTWTDNLNGGSRTGTWSITDGVSVPMIHTPVNNAVVTTSAFTEIDWTDSIGSSPPFEYKYEAYSDPGYSTLVYSTPTWLSSSEIPTPGTSPGDYYVRVMARNSDSPADESAWSNGAGNPYKISVTADPVNPFPVPQQCDQEVSYNLIEGTNGSNSITGTNGPDLILAGNGSDSVNGMGGNDCIVGGNGSDRLLGGSGHDVILGGAGADSIQGEAGDDDLYGEESSDSISGGNGDDELFGGAAADSLRGDAGSDILDGGAASDSANGGAGNDTCTAESEASCEL